MVCFSGGCKQTFSWVNKFKKKALESTELSPMGNPSYWRAGGYQKRTYKNREGGKSKGEWQRSAKITRAYREVKYIWYWQKRKKGFVRGRDYAASRVQRKGADERERHIQGGRIEGCGKLYVNFYVTPDCRYSIWHYIWPGSTWFE